MAASERKAKKPAPSSRETVLKGVEVVEFAPPDYKELGSPTVLGESETDSNNDPLVNQHVIPVSIPVELVVPSLGTQRRMLALLDLSCTKCVVSLEVVEKLGLRLKQLKVPITFCQLNRTGGAQLIYN